MNDQTLGIYVLPLNPDSDWKYLYIAEGARNLKDQIARRPIKEPAYLTVYTNSGDWFAVVSAKGRRGKAIRLDTHIVSDEEADLIWNSAKAIYDNHVSFKSDLENVRQTLFPKVKRHAPYYISPVN